MRVEVRLLGSFGMNPRQLRLTLPMLAQRLAAFLAIQDGASRVRAAGTLWPDVDESRAQANLRTALWRLRATSIELVDACASALRLADDVVVDLRRGEDVAHQILDGRLPSSKAVSDIALLSADLLPDWDDEWLLFERERYRELRVHALERLCERLTDDGEYASAIECGMLAVDAEPLRESAHRALMRTFVAEGNPVKAMDQFHELEDRLRDELSVEPSLPTLELAMDSAPTGVGPALRR